MPVMAIYQAQGVDKDAYAKFRARVPLDKTPPGALLHLCSLSDAGDLLVVDVWADEATMHSFDSGTIVENLLAVGLEPVTPDVRHIDTLFQSGELAAYDTIVRASEPA